MRTKNKLTYSEKAYANILKNNLQVTEDKSVNRDTGASDTAKHVQEASKIADNLLFDSILECQRYGLLKRWEKAKVIRNLTTQHADIGLPIEERKHWWLLTPSYRNKSNKLVKAQYYVDDFQYYIGDVLIIEDIKGYPRRVFLNKWKILETKYPDKNFFLNFNLKGWYPDDTERWQRVLAANAAN